MELDAVCSLRNARCVYWLRNWIDVRLLLRSYERMHNFFDGNKDVEQIVKDAYDVEAWIEIWRRGLSPGCLDGALEAWIEPWRHGLSPGSVH